MNPMMTIFEIFIYHIIILKKRICLLMPMALLLQVFACHLTLACRITSGALFTKVIVCTVRLSCITGLLLQIFSASRDLNPPHRSSWTCCARRASSSGRTGGQIVIQSLFYSESTVIRLLCYTHLESVFSIHCYV